MGGLFAFLYPQLESYRNHQAENSRVAGRRMQRGAGGPGRARIGSNICDATRLPESVNRVVNLP